MHTSLAWKLGNSLIMAVLMPRCKWGKPRKLKCADVQFSNYGLGSCFPICRDVGHACWSCGSVIQQRVRNKREGGLWPAVDINRLMVMMKKKEWKCEVCSRHLRAQFVTTVYVHALAAVELVSNHNRSASTHSLSTHNPRGKACYCWC